jgi:hypothetical protein
MVGENFLEIHYLIIVVFAVVFSGIMWTVFFLVGKKIHRMNIKISKNAFGAFVLIAILYLIKSIILTSNLEIRIILTPITIAICHASYLSCFRRANKNA